MDRGLIDKWGQTGRDSRRLWDIYWVSDIR